MIKEQAQMVKKKLVEYNVNAKFLTTVKNNPKTSFKQLEQQFVGIQIVIF